jgi:hypothetical protein
MNRAEVDPESVWVEQVVHAKCRNCGMPLRRHINIPGISRSNSWYHPHNSFKSHNGYECDPVEPNKVSNND